jgi:ribosomal-protein-alanine N-acetyltransferase
MKTVLQTKRLLLRELNAEDAENMYLLNLDPEVIRYTGDGPFASEAEARLFLENYDHYKKYGMGRWAVISQSDEAFLGWCGLKFSPDAGEHDIGFRFFRKYWSRGYATEAAEACLEYGFDTLGLTSIVGRAMRDNLTSIRVLEKIGLRYHSDFDFEGQPGVVYRLDRQRYRLTRH